MSAQPDFFSTSTQAANARGFRLDAVELYNWGTFHRHIATLGCGRANTLLTGDIGAGKSTVVDALTTLLVPHQRITYNRAAGAEAGERRLATYVRGAYKSTQTEEGSGRTVSLRDEREFSVLLARFADVELGETVTLAQVFWMVEGQAQPEKYFVVAENGFGISELLNVSPNPGDLRKRLRKTPGVTVYQQFNEYQTHWRRLFGIAQEHALGLFYQTVSLKSIGNLTDFIRTHMLDAPALEDRIRGLVEGFANLNAAHEAVLKARRQVELLTPIREDGARLLTQSAEQEERRGLRDALDSWRAAHRLRLIELECARLTEQQAAAERKRERVLEQLGTKGADERELERDIDRSGGQRLRDIERELTQLEPLQRKQVEQDKHYKQVARTLELPVRAEAEHFIANQARARQIVDEAQALDAGLSERRDAIQVEIARLRSDERSLAQEIEALSSRRSNIPRSRLLMREALCRALGCEEAALPFAGELIEVEEIEATWEGAIERVLHGFAQSLLVADALYAAVSAHVDQTQLNERLVYFRTHTDVPPPKQVAPASLANKLRLNDQSPFYGWLRARLHQDFDYLCCDSLEQFRRESRALTRSGQLKSGGARHEKDDRHRIDDRTRYVLGWSNAAKLRALKTRLIELQHEGAQAFAQRLAIDQERTAVATRRDSARDLANLRDFNEIDWPATARRIRELREEHTRIEASSDLLQTLRERLVVVREELAKLGQSRDRLSAEIGGIEKQLLQHAEHADSAREVLATSAPPGARFPQLDALCGELAGARELTLRTLDPLQSELRQRLGNEIDAGERRIKTIEERLARQIEVFRRAYPADAADFDLRATAWPEYAELLAAIERDDLPRFEVRFRELLRQETIRGVALFNAGLEHASKAIRAKVAEINRSLAGIEYNPGTRIELLVEAQADAEVRQFRADLVACLSDTVGADDSLYSEQKFLQVKALIERFNGRTGLTEIDRRWTEKVTDVRQWFVFSASERYRETGEEREYYADSAGKSGGQKEKLAYTILASALAFQFGADSDTPRTRSFRFVMIDEAFGRGTDDSARYALDLFQRMDLQLLIVTPLQKIHVIEDYVAQLHFISNTDGCDSRVRTISIEAHRSEKRARKARG